MGAFKDEINRSTITTVARAITAADPSFPAGAFVAGATTGLDGLALKARVTHIARALGTHLPTAFPAAAGIVTRALDQAHGGMWEWWPVTEWVALHGRGHPDLALELLGRLTPRASAEFAIRPFLDDDADRVRRTLDHWASSDDEHQRRLVSEGTRPRLPWGARVPLLEREPSWAVPLLDRLHDDDSADVRRSVANHLNDLCKVAPDVALATATRWNDEAAAHTPALVRHGLRTLVKAGHPDALRLIGVDPHVAVSAELTLHTPEVAFGGAALFTVAITSHEATAQRLVLDYAVTFARKNGAGGRKVFKWKVLTLGPGARRVLERRHPITPVTVRAHHPGRHHLDIQVNGKVAARASFELEFPPEAADSSPTLST